MGDGGIFGGGEKSVEAACRDLERSFLAALSGVFHQLVYLASLRDPSTRRYVHWGMENLYGAEAAQEAFHRVHRSVFSRVASLPPEALEAEIGRFLSGGPAWGADLFSAHTPGAPVDRLVPDRADGAEADRFRLTLDTVLTNRPLG
ncbi:MAG: hypothetical protein KA419_04145 [Acidobacteria bacterium]|nr:hypothetical protein [Acidobacteriota bacterium]